MSAAILRPARLRWSAHSANVTRCRGWPTTRLEPRLPPGFVAKARRTMLQCSGVQLLCWWDPEPNTAVRGWLPCEQCTQSRCASSCSTRSCGAELCRTMPSHNVFCSVASQRPDSMHSMPQLMQCKPQWSKAAASACAAGSVSPGCLRASMAAAAAAAALASGRPALRSISCTSPANDCSAPGAGTPCTCRYAPSCPAASPAAKPLAVLAFSSSVAGEPAKAPVAT